MENVKIINQIDDTHFIIEVTPVDINTPEHVKIARDYVEFFANTNLELKDTNNEGLSGPNALCHKQLSVRTSVQIQIRDFVQVTLPLLNLHPYCQPNHLQFREPIKTSSSTVEQKGYWPYSCYSSAISYWKDTVRMIAFRMDGEPEFNHVTEEFYNKFVKPNLYKEKP